MVSESRSRDAKHPRNDRPISICRNGMCDVSSPLHTAHHIQGTHNDRIPNSLASLPDLSVPSKRRQTITIKPCAATSISSSSSKSASRSQTRKVISLKTLRRGSLISGLTSGASYTAFLPMRVQVTRYRPLFFFCFLSFFLARTCMRQSRSICCRNRGLIFRDTRRWGSGRMILQSSSSPLVSSSFQKLDGYRFTGELNPTSPAQSRSSIRHRYFFFPRRVLEPVAHRRFCLQIYLFFVLTVAMILATW